MKSIDLIITMKRLGTRKLSKLVSLDRLEVIDDILSGGITESSLVKILVLRYGTQILSDPDIRNTVIAELADSYKGYLLDGNFVENRVLTKNEETKLQKQKWGRTSSFSTRLLEVFGLTEDYLPPVALTPPSHEVINPGSILFPYQRRVKDRFVRMLSQKTDRILVHMPTGAGKTRTCIEGIIDYWRTIADRSGYIVWLAHSEELCEQAIETFKKIWEQRGDSPMSLYRLWGAVETPEFTESNGIIVASLQKVYSMMTSQHDEAFEKIASIKSKCRLIVIDEAHKAVAPTYKASIDYITNYADTKLIGLTATPGRGVEEGETAELVEFFDRKKITITDENGVDVPNPIKALQEQGYLARIKRKRIHTNISVELTEKEKQFVATFLDVPPSVLKKLAGSSERNALILAEIGALYVAGKHIIVFALSVEHAHLLAELLLLRGIEARCVDSLTSAFDRKQIIDDYKSGDLKVLINFGVLTTGFDAPNTNAVMIARPTGSIVLYSQMVGRGIRGPNMGGNEECTLVDLEDNLTGFPDENQAFNFFNDEWN